MDILLLYLVLINALSFVLMLVDKYKAKNKLWRIQESMLLTVAAIGGSLGCFIGMRVCRHKTKKEKFSIGVPVIMAVHILILYDLMQHL